MSTHAEYCDAHGTLDDCPGSLRRGIGGFTTSQSLRNHRFTGMLGRELARVDARAAIRDAASYLGKCITVQGMEGGRMIYADVDAVYRRPQRQNDTASNGGTLGYDYFGPDHGGRERN